MFEKFFSIKKEKNEEVLSELAKPQKNEKEELSETEKMKKAEEILYLLIDAIDELLPEGQNAIIRADKNRSNGIWDHYVKDLTEGVSPVFYIDNGGITRMQVYNNELVIVHSGEMPSRIEGKTIQAVWDEVKDKYNSRIFKLANELKI